MLHSLFQALCECGRLKKRVGDERGLVRIPLTADPTCRLLAFFIVLTDREPGTGHMLQRDETRKFELFCNASVNVKPEGGGGGTPGICGAFDLYLG